MRKQIILLLPFIAVLWVYGAVWQFDYVWDDIALLLNNVQLRHAAGAEEVMQAVTRPILPGTTYFRPAVLFTFWLEFQFTGGDPKVSHAVNLGIHLLNVALVGILATAVLRPAAHRVVWVPAIAMTFYGLNPTLHEAVCWVAGRFDLLATTCVLASCLALTASRIGFPRLALGSLAFLLGMLSKEVAVVTPVLVLGICALRTVASSRDSCMAETRGAHVLVTVRPPMAAMLLVMIVYLLMRLHFMPSLVHENPAFSGFTLFYRLALIGKTVSFYTVTGLFPFIELSPQHPYDPGALGWREVVVLTCAVAIVVASVIRAFRGSSGAILILMVFVCLLPVLNVIPLTIGENVGHERFLTLPVAFMALIAAQVVTGAMNYMSTPVVGTACVLIIALFVANLRVTVPLWRNELTLWSWAYSQHPDSTFVQHSIVTAAAKWGDLKLARRVIEKARERGPSEAMLFLEADLLVKEQKYDLALSLANTVMASKPRLHEKYGDLSVASKEEVAQSALENWHLPGALVTIGNAYISTRRFKEAEIAASHALFYSPNLPPAMLVRAYAIWGQGRVQEGDAAYREALEAYATPVQDSVHELTKSYLSQLCGTAKLAFACDSRYAR